MSDVQLEVKISKLVAQSGFRKSDEMICPIMKIIQMRHKNISKDQVLRIAKSVLK